jgi:hypothetical protein
MDRNDILYEKMIRAEKVCKRSGSNADFEYYLKIQNEYLVLVRRLEEMAKLQNEIIRKAILFLN